MSDEVNAVEQIRIDKFLFFTRFFKSRSQAGRAVAQSGARVTRDGQTRRIDKGSTSVEIGDVLAFTCPRGIIALTIRAIPPRRGPAQEARTCYELSEQDPV